MTRTEEQAAQDLAKQEPGAVVLKMTATGNPDFIVIPKELADSVRFVEVKAGGDKVKPHQEVVHRNLRGSGFRVDVIRITDDGAARTEPAPPRYELCPECGAEVCQECGTCEEDEPCIHVAQVDLDLSEDDPDYAAFVAERCKHDAYYEEAITQALFENAGLLQRPAPSVISNETAVAQ